MAAELLGANGASTTVASGGYSSGATHLNVASTSTGVGLTPFPLTGNFRVSIFNASSLALEAVLLVTAINSGTQFATTAEVDGNASAGDIVLCSITSGGMGALLAQMNQTSTFPAPATVPFAGARWKQTDGPYEAISNGSAWQYYWNGYPVTPPPSSGWTSEGIASESGSTAGLVHYTNGFGYLIGNSLNSQSVGVNYRSAPGSTPYSFIARMAMDTSGVIATKVYGIGAALATIAGFAIGFRDSAGKYLVMCLAAFAGNDPFLCVYHLASDTSSPSSTIFLESRVIHPIFSKDFIFRIRNDGTNLYFDVSIDSQNFATLYSEAITSHLTDANNVCWGALKDGASAAVCLYDWTQGT